MMWTTPIPVRWPEGRKFAFTIFDDPDSQSLEDGREVYAFLAAQGFRTTKGVWPLRPTRPPSDHGGTCGDPAYAAWVKQLQEQDFEIGFHNATAHTSTRQETLAGLEEFRRQFGDYPRSMAHHYFCQEGLYWGDLRVSGWRRAAYNLLTGGRNHCRFSGHIEAHPNFWADLCQQRIQYVRNFVFAEINTLKACPWMPYHDPHRPYVNYWYASSEGANCDTFVELIREPSQERLEQEGGACIAYTHFGHGYFQEGILDRRFRERMERLSRRPGWFVPVSTLLDYLRSQGRGGDISDRQRAGLERRWLLHKVRFGTA